MNPVAAPSLRDFFDAWPLFRDPVLAALLCGASVGALSVYVVLRRMVFVSAALSQAAGFAVTAALFAQVALGATGVVAAPPLWAVVAAVATTFLLARRSAEGGASRDGRLGFLYLAATAGTLLLAPRLGERQHDVQEVLFGTGVLVAPEQLTRVAWMAGAVLLLELACGRGLRFASFDPEGARVRGLPVTLLDAALLGAVAISVAISAQALGVLPVFALSVLPAMGAVTLAPHVPAAILAASLLGALAGALGYLAAFLYELPVGAAQTALAAAAALAMIGARRLGGVLRRARA